MSSTETARTNRFVEEVEPIALRGTVEEFIHALDQYDLQAASDMPGAPRLIDVALVCVVEASFMHGFSEQQKLMLDVCHQRGADFNSHGAEGLKLITTAVCEHAPGMVQALREHGASLGPGNRNDEENWSRSPLMVAISEEHFEMVPFLIEKSNLEDVDEDGWTALFFAVKAGRVEIVRDLIEAGACINACDHSGDRVLHVNPWGMTDQAREIGLMLLRAGANPAALDSDGLLPPARRGKDGWAMWHECVGVIQADQEAQSLQGSTLPSPSKSNHRRM